MSGIYRAIRCALGRHEAQSVTYRCGCSQEKCGSCGAWRRWVCDDHVRVAGLRSERVGLWP